ncbi:MAG TPA: Stp1/IreP family PP2C-type Ser/Thr phosphatase [Acidimicrobiales bacterium]|nr:Stp1/IreP family PP2C-type Ser/Thr phosphatase [Acidimicrobiales bacterium]
MTALRASSATDAGRVRTSNQDLALVAGDLVAVADGMGGHAGGEVAARTAVRVLQEAFERDHSAGGLRSAADRANREIFDRSERERELRGMGTTLTAAAVVSGRDGERLAVVNVGDSRAYLLNGGRLSRLTEDHSLVEEMVRHGELSPDEAAVHPHRHILTRALGIDPGVEIDSWLLDLQLGARLLLCSDGLTNECGDDEIALILTEYEDPSEAAQALVQQALDHGGSDNVTVVVADVVDAPPAAAATAPAAAAEADAPGAAPGEARGPRAVAEAPPTTTSTTTVRDAAGAAAAAGALSALAPASGGAARRARAAGAPVSTGHDRPRPPDTGQVPRSSRPQSLLVLDPGRRRSRERTHGDRIVTPWSVLFVLVFVGVLGGIAGFVGWYVRATFFVGFSGDQVVIYQGRPGGYLWFEPTIVERTSLTRTQVFPPYVPLIQAGMVEASYDAAKHVVSNLTNANAFLALPTADTTAAANTTTTTFALPTTTVSTTTTTTPTSTTLGATTSTRRATRRPTGPESATAAAVTTIATTTTTTVPTTVSTAAAGAGGTG